MSPCSSLARRWCAAPFPGRRRSTSTGPATPAAGAPRAPAAFKNSDTCDPTGTCRDKALTETFVHRRRRLTIYACSGTQNDRLGERLRTMRSTCSLYTSIRMTRHTLIHMPIHVSRQNCRSHSKMARLLFEPLWIAMFPSWQRNQFCAL